MIARLRRRHRGFALAAMVTAPLILVAALADRKPAARDATPLGAAPAANVSPLDEIGRGTLYAGAAPLVAALYQTGDDALALVLSRTDSVGTVGPDVLVYWQARPIDSLAGDARLLGPLGTSLGRQLALPVTQREGVILLYSLARHNVLASAALSELQ